MLQVTGNDWKSKGINILAGFAICVIWTAIVTLGYHFLFNAPVESHRFEYPGLIQIVSGCVFAPLIEELMYRHVPLQLVKRTGLDYLLIPTLLLSSVIFGLAHYGPFSVPLQGVGGFIIAMVYIKNGYSYWSAVILHFLWNMALSLGFINFNW